MKVAYFVDDERHILDGLRRGLRALRNDWRFEFHDNGQSALARMRELPPDVVVSDMRMPSMDGVEFLGLVRRDHPHSIRLVLSGNADFDSIANVMQSAHQVLSKPCDPEQLTRVLDNARLLSDRFADRSLSSVVCGLKSLPAIPGILGALMDLLQRGDGDQRRVGALIARDPGLSVRVLQIANSGFFGCRQRIESIDQAVVLLGENMLKNLVTQVKVVEAFPAQALFSAEDFGGRVAAITERALDILGSRSFQGDLRSVALAMDVGQLVFASRVPAAYEAVLREVEAAAAPLWEVERRRLGADHAAVGAFLLGLWGQERRLVDLVARHLEPLGAGEDEPLLVALHAAEALVDARDDRERFEGLLQPGVLGHQLVQDYVARMGSFV